jgi:hypothetical protein
MDLLLAPVVCKNLLSGISVGVSFKICITDHASIRAALCHF